MGYTHYWYLNKKSEEVVGSGFQGSRFFQAVIDMDRIVDASRIPLAGWDGGGEPEIDIDNGKVSFNGIGDNAHESFIFQRFGTQKVPIGVARVVDRDKEFSFCKTAQKPYDVVVVACLAVAAQVIGDGIEVSTDGEVREWEEGVAFASRVLDRDVPVPSFK